MTYNFDTKFQEHIEFTSATFPKGTSDGALLHLEREIAEVRAETKDSFDLAVEFADCLGCLIDAANRRGVTPPMLLHAFAYKLDINKARTWKDNGDGSYSHVK